MHIYALLMGMMTRRLQILIDEERYALLEREAQRTGRPVARRAAYDVVLAAEPMPVDDWPAMKQELLVLFEQAPRPRHAARRDRDQPGHPHHHLA
jgi:hypothetical protein